ncbi:helix-turn-helix domain-containing protein [Streptomyces sp. R41]|uniref:Helix-turn-helix domain-containing protein n=1 Tax=Streptomyces sp. R41 TaxID=3238632 RepID=A0AB39R9Z9_9ACTN
MIVTHAYRFALDPTAGQVGALLRHAGAGRVAFNWGLARVKANLSQREAERWCPLSWCTGSVAGSARASARGALPRVRTAP